MIHEWRFVKYSHGYGSKFTYWPLTSYLKEAVRYVTLGCWQCFTFFQNGFSKNYLPFLSFFFTFFVLERCNINWIVILGAMMTFQSSYLRKLLAAPIVHCFMHAKICWKKNKTVSCQFLHHSSSGSSTFGLFCNPQLQGSIRLMPVTSTTGSWKSQYWLLLKIDSFVRKIIACK